MYYVYVLKSKTKRKCYIGYTSDLRRRVSEHNNGKNPSTKYGTPWKVIYYEAYQSDALARKREQILKQRGKVWRTLRQKLFQYDDA